MEDQSSEEVNSPTTQPSAGKKTHKSRAEKEASGTRERKGSQSSGSHHHRHGSKGMPKTKAAALLANRTFTPEEEAAATKIQKFLKSAFLRYKWLKLVDELKTSDKAVRPRNRFRVMKEIISSEKKYVSDLEFLITTYYDPLKSASSVLSTSDFNRIFSNVKMIYQFNKTFLKKLETRSQQWPKDMKIGDVFLEMAELFHVYIPYVNGSADAIELLGRCLEENKAFKEFTLKAVVVTPDSKQLNAFLIMPVQRVPRYELLLKNLLELTDPGHVDYDNLARALAKIKSINDRINERKREKDLAQMVLGVQKSIIEPVKIAEATRKLLGETDLASISVNPPDTPVAKRIICSSPHLVLFTNALMLLQKEPYDEKTQTQRYHYKDLWPIVCVDVIKQAPLTMSLQDSARCLVVRVSDPMQSPHSATASLVKKSEMVDLLLMTSNNEAKLEWVEKIVKARDDETTKLNRMRSLSETRSLYINPTPISKHLPVYNSAALNTFNRRRSNSTFNVLANEETTESVKASDSGGNDAVVANSLVEFREIDKTVEPAPETPSSKRNSVKYKQSSPVPRWLARAAALSPSNKSIRKTISPLVAVSSLDFSDEEDEASVAEEAPEAPTSLELDEVAMNEDDFNCNSLFSILSETLQEIALNVANAQVSVAASSSLLDKIASWSVEQNELDYAKASSKARASQLSERLKKERDALNNSKKLLESAEGEEKNARLKLDAQSKRVLKARDDLSAAKRDVEEKKSKLDHAKSDMEQVEEATKALNTCIQNCELEAGSLEKEADALNAQAETLREQSKALSEELKKNKSKVSEQKKEQEELNKRLAEAQKRRDDLIISRITRQREIETEQRRLDTTRNAIQSTLIQTSDMERSLAELRIAVAKEEAEVAKEEARVEILNSQSTRLQEEIEQLQKRETDAKKQKHARRSELSKLHEQSRKLAEDRDKMEMKRLEMFVSVNKLEVEHKRVSANCMVQQNRYAVVEALYEELGQMVTKQSVAMDAESSVMKAIKDLQNVFEEKKRQTEDASSTLSQHVQQLDDTRVQILRKLRESTNCAQASSVPPDVSNQFTASGRRRSSSATVFNVPN